MSKRDYLLAIGIMTGNSLDGADLVLTRFNNDDSVQDLSSHFGAYPESLRRQLKELREAIMQVDGVMGLVEKEFSSTDGKSFADVEQSYSEFLAAKVKELIIKAKSDSELSRYYDLDHIDLIGSHGQTCAHCPPSVINEDSDRKPYTVQIGSGQKLADLTGITVVSDFRSDDMFNGGEGAPLAPAHHKRIALHLKNKGYFPIAFVNGGNTGNMSLITHREGSDAVFVLGWDAGPFNHYPDTLMQTEKGALYDVDAVHASQGSIDMDLLAHLYDDGVVTESGDNFLQLHPPRSSDPQWYRLPPELTEKNIELQFEDRLRTAVYFSVYTLFHSLTLIKEDIVLPSYFAVSGGGWKNPLCLPHFRALLTGDTTISPILPGHEDNFEKVRSKLDQEALVVEHSQFFGIDGTAMEARLFADAAVSKVNNIPFSFTDTTGAKTDTVLGIVHAPRQSMDSVTPAVKDLLALSGDSIARDSLLWSRASSK